MNRWRVVVGGVSMNLALGSLYAWSVFVLPLEKEFGWTRSQTSWVYTIAVVVFASTFVLAGRLQDRLGPRPCAFAGAILVWLGFFVASFTTSLWFLYVAFGLVVGAGNGFGYATPMPVASKWFPDRRGLVVGLMVGGYGAGSAIIGPIATSLITSVGWRPTFRMLGVVFLAMGLIGAWLLENPPHGYRPPGGTPLSVFASATAHLYGTRNLGLNYGVLSAAWGAAGVFGPMIGGRVFDTFGDYRYAFYAASALAIAAFGSLAMVRPLRARGPERPALRT